jgi:hypothetical protein
LRDAFVPLALQRLAQRCRARAEPGIGGAPLGQRRRQLLAEVGLAGQGTQPLAQHRVLSLTCDGRCSASCSMPALARGRRLAGLGRPLRVKSGGGWSRSRIWPKVCSTKRS